jgi:selenocysteine-specific elongation factor
MIIATAGHIDHGKTLLVKALTGTDADRLPEEKKRGMTLDLGFAYTNLDNGVRLGFIDVPGHERLVHNMLAGVTGIDCALLVVAADDGPMPQTREHLAILDLLGVSQGLVALTKIDRVSEERVHEVHAEIELMLADSTLSGVPIFPVSGVTNTGIEELTNQICTLSQEIDIKAANGNFRLGIDRMFTVAGAGLIVTGTAFSGQVTRGDRLWIAGFGTQARVRGIHANNAEREKGQAGDRLAINLAGIDRDDIARGDWLVADPALQLYKKLDVHLRVVADARRPLRHWTPVHVHVGAKNVTGRVAVLGNEAIEPGQSGLAQLVLDEAIGACANDRFVIRDQSAQITLGGGHVVDLFPPRRGRARADRLAMLDALSTPDHGAALKSALALSETGISLNAFLITRNLTSAEAKNTIAATDAVVAGDGTDRLAISPAAWNARRTEFLTALDAFHIANPDRLGPASIQLRRSLGRYMPKPLFGGMVASLIADTTINSDGMLLHRPAHQPGLTGNDAKHWQLLLPLLEETPEAPPAVHNMAESTGLSVGATMKTLRQAVRMGMLVQIAGNRFFAPTALRAHAQIFEDIIAAKDEISVSDFRAVTGIGRNLAVEILEYFDRVKISQRDGNIRRQVKSVEVVFGVAPGA